MTDEKYLEKLGKKIAELRKKKSLTQVQLGKKLNKHHSAIARIELGNVNSTINMLRTIAKELDVSIEGIVKID